MSSYNLAHRKAFVKGFWRDFYILAKDIYKIKAPHSRGFYLEKNKA